VKQPSKSRSVVPNKSLHSPPDASVTALAFATAAPDAGASELKRYTPPKHFLDAGPRTVT
jgi:hypothetical protein